MPVRALSSGCIVDRHSTPLKGVMRTLIPFMGMVFELEARDFNHVRLHNVFIWFRRWCIYFAGWIVNLWVQDMDVVRNAMEYFL